MPPKKAPLSESNANATPRKSSGKQKAISAQPKEKHSHGKETLDDVVKGVTKTHGRKRAREGDVSTEGVTASGNGGPNQVSDPKDGEQKGTKSPPAKKTKTNKDDSGKKGGSDNRSKKKSDGADDISDIRLDREESGSTPVFDTCNDIRTKILAHLRKETTSMTALGRSMAETYTVANKPRSVTGAQIRSFLQKKGPTAGATSGVFYAGYIYFEKLRLKQKKSKSKKRLEMEEAHGPDGMSTEHDASTNFTILGSEKAVTDRLGITRFEPRR